MPMGATVFLTRLLPGPIPGMSCRWMILSRSVHLHLQHVQYRCMFVRHLFLGRAVCLFPIACRVSTAASDIDALSRSGIRDCDWKLCFSEAVVTGSPISAHNLSRP